MILRGWHIDGFGVFHDTRRTDLGDGVTVVCSPNEAGKSTLLAFIRGVLFGFPDGRSKEPRYEPVHGGQHGGRLFLEHDGHTYTVARRADKKQPPRILNDAGEDVPEGVLEQLLGGADSRLFRNIFGFTLDELQALRSLTDDSVRERIFSGAVAGAGRSARKAVDDLTEQADALYKPDGRAKNNRVAGLLNELKTLDDKLTAARREAEAYPDTLAAERDAERRVQDFRAQLDRQQARRDWLAKLDRLWAPWRDRRAAVDALTRAAPPGFDPERPDEPGAVLTETAREAERLAQQAEPQRERLERLAALDRQIRDRRERLTATLETLGTAWSEDAVAAFTLPIPTREEIRQWDGALSEHAQAVEQAEERLKQAASEAERAEGERKRLARELDELGEAPEPVATLQARVRALETLRARLSQRASQAEKVRNLEQTAADRRAHADALSRRVPGRAWSLAAVALGALLIAGGAGLYVLGAVLAAAIVAGVGVAGAAGLLLLVRWLRRRAWTDAAEAEARATEAEREAEHARQELAQAESGLADLAEQAGLAATPDEAGSAAALAETHAAVDRRRQWEARKRALDDAAKAADEAEKAREAAVTARDEAVEARDALAERWLAWKRDHGLPEHLSPQGVLDFASELNTARETVGAIHGDERQRGQLAEAIADWTEAARGVLHQRGRTAPEDDTALIDAFAQEADAIAEERRQIQTIADAEAAIAREAGDDGERAAALKADLAGGDPDAWARETAELDTAIAETRQAWETAAGDLRQARADRERVERASDVAELETRRNALIAEMQDAYRRWQTLTTARALVERTLKTYERERQPAVVARAGDHFARVTGGRYSRVVQDSEGGGIDVLDHRGERLRPDQLSRGTREQLYLSVRLGLAAEFAQRGTVLPLVMDEILVNFDPERMTAMARELHQVAAHHQVILFTCHPMVAETVATAGPATVIDNLRADAGTATQTSAA
ncbi:Uncharacterized protein YhaN [Limimonas halophila]|uniref:Uncharacterized protein YhaN n=1 Tax=Limimonas halophila TaxID=1082479 RepID=A0A1G7QP49_9PROT|nr:AAA family ATPase [Limimonas halophila]SDG00306.1 Uncharacterized protein YhaN [Limimonas halophila]